MNVKRSAATAAAALLLAVTATACTGSPASPSSETKTAKPGRSIQHLQSATLGEPTQIRPNVGAMALCNNGKISVFKTKSAAQTPVKINFTVQEGGNGKDCRIATSIDSPDKKGKPATHRGFMVLHVKPNAVEASGLFAQDVYFRDQLALGAKSGGALVILMEDDRVASSSQWVGGLESGPDLHRVLRATGTSPFKELMEQVQ